MSISVLFAQLCVKEDTFWVERMGFPMMNRFFTSTKMGRRMLYWALIQRWIACGMPVDFLLVRHGESEGNVYNKARKKGRKPEVPDAFRARHGSEWRLTPRGIEQAVAAGIWICRNIGLIDRLYTSTHIRAMETSGRMALPNALWFLNILQRERDWGVHEFADRAQDEEYLDMRARMEDQPLLIAPDGGESLVSVIARACLPLYDTLARECSMQKVAVVCHGETMWAHYYYLTRMTPWRFREIDQSKHPHNRIHNCQIIQFSRRDPNNGRIRPSLDFVRWVCPWDPSLSSGEWQEIDRPVLGNQDLLAHVEQFPQLITGTL